jgi:hypothetical protein
LEEDDLNADFSSMAAAAMVPFEREEKDINRRNAQIKEKQLESLQPISKSLGIGKTYNSFRKYGTLMKPKAVDVVTKQQPQASLLNLAKDDVSEPVSGQSRLIGGGMGSTTETMKSEDDDGEGWITSKSDIFTMKAVNGRQWPSMAASIR